MLFTATQDPKYRDEAVSAMDNYMLRMNNPKGKWDTSMPYSKKRLNLGIYMIFVNLANVLRECIGTTAYDEEEHKAVDLILDRFWNEEHGVIFENVNAELGGSAIDLESCDGRHIIPGHGLETCWFLIQYAEQMNRPEIVPKVCRIIKSLLEFAWDNENGGLFYFKDVLGKPHPELEWDMKLWWVHNEALIAVLYAYRWTKDKIFLDWFKKLHDWSWTHFRDPQYGEWFGYLNRQGAPTLLLKAGRWKAFFHLPRQLIVCSEQIELITATQKD